MLESPQLAGIREAFTLTIDPTGNAFSYEVPHAADDRGLWAEAEGSLLPCSPLWIRIVYVRAWWSAKW